MPTPSIQTLRADAQQVLNLDSISAVRSVVAATLANANAGTPLNPNLTTQQLWNEFYQIVTQPKSDIESIIANQLMKFLYAPPAPGGAGADKQVIFNDGGVLAGDAQFLWNKTTNLLTVTGSATITGDLTVDTNVLKVDTTNNRVGINTASPTAGMALDIVSATSNNFVRFTDGVNATGYLGVRAANGAVYLHANNNIVSLSCSTSNTTPTEQLRITNPGVFEFLDGAGGTRMTLNSTGLGVGRSPSYRLQASSGTKATTASLATVAGITTTDADDFGIYFRLKTDATGANRYAAITSFDNGSGNGARDLVLQDLGGNVGIGVTPVSGQKLTVLTNIGISASTATAADDRLVFSENMGSVNLGSQIVWQNSSFLTPYASIGVSNGAAGSNGTLIFSTCSSIFTNTNTERVRIKPTGQVRFFPLAADPAGAEAGDVYYNSTDNKLKCYNGTTWNDLF